MLRFAFAAVLLLLMSPTLVRGQAPQASVRIGTYDSRAIAVAYARSDVNRQWMSALMAEREEARKAGDEWEVAYRDPSVEYVDVTMPLVKKFGADAAMLKMLDQLMKQPPVPMNQLVGHIER